MGDYIHVYIIRCKTFVTNATAPIQLSISEESRKDVKTDLPTWKRGYKLHGGRSSLGLRFREQG